MTFVRIYSHIFLCDNYFMLLVIDIGNTNTNIGIYDKNGLIKVYGIASDHIKTSDEYGILISSLLLTSDIKTKINACIISSVVPTLGETIKKAVEEYINVEVYNLSYKSKLPVKILLDEPKEAGADRLANASAAAVLYKLPVIVIDIGTATTFDIIDKNANFIGGIIAPGPLIQAKSLSQFTSKLPKLKIEAPKNAIGRNTIDAMLSGIVMGHKKMVEGMVKLCEKELGEKATIVATGGFSKALFSNMECNIDYINKDLTLFGLKTVYEINKGEKI